jgi:hypothetical protein
MAYAIVRTARGKRSVVATGSLPKMNRRLKQLRASTTRGVSGRGCAHYKARYDIVPGEGDSTCSTSSSVCR